MINKSVVTSLLIVLSSSAVHAEGLYGSVTGSVGDTSLNGSPPVGSPTDEPDAFKTLSFGGSLGYLTSSGFYGQIDLRFTDNGFETAEDHYTSGQLGVVRVGKSFDRFSIGAFVGQAETDTDDDATDQLIRSFFGIEGAYDANENLQFYGQIGSIGGPRGNDSGGDDGMHDGRFVIAGVDVDLDERLSLNGFLGYGEGRMDGDDMDVHSFGLKLTYQFNNPGLSAYVGVTQNQYFQDESGGERMGEPVVKIGMTYEFGGGRAQARTRLQPLHRIEDWIGHTGGALE